MLLSKFTFILNWEGFIMNIPYIPIVTDLDAELPFHIVNAGQREPQPHIRRPSGLPEFQWLHCDEGEGILLINKKGIHLQRAWDFSCIPMCLTSITLQLAVGKQAT